MNAQVQPNLTLVDRHYLTPDADRIQALSTQWNPSSDRLQSIEADAIRLIEQIRTHQSPSLMEAFLAEYGLDTEEGLALMTLAEALLRIPDAQTRDALIQDKLLSGDWASHQGRADAQLINLATLGLRASAWVLGDPMKSFSKAVHRLGAAVIRQAMLQAMRLMGQQFVLGQNMDGALSQARKLERQGYTYSYDMLGEAAMTEHDAERYFDAYRRAILALQPSHTTVRENPGISVKLSALHPRYEMTQRDRVLRELTPKLVALCQLAKAQNVGLNIDAEEADRLMLSLEVIESVLSRPDLAGWDGFGVVVQAYSKRAPEVIDWLYQQAVRLDRQIMVRLVKGAYWDAEIKRAQVMGLADYPVYTTKAATDLSYLACAQQLFGMLDRIYPQFATHNAHTAAAVKQLAPNVECFEFQRLHGMGESLHQALRGQGYSVRIYAPVGPHADLLAYLVRRLLENGANSSFVNQLVNPEVPAQSMAKDPREAALSADSPIELPSDMFGTSRNNAQGWDWTNSNATAELMRDRQSYKTYQWPSPTEDDQVSLTNKLNRVSRGQSAFAALDVAERDAILRRYADLLESNAPELMALLAIEAKKTLPDAIGEIREAVDFARYYADLPCPGEPRGVFVCISPWNFPLAIFSGQILAALKCGNTVLAKPAPQTPKIAARAVQLLVEAGLPKDALALAIGGAEVGQWLTAQSKVNGVCFTGSTSVAQSIHQSIARHMAPDTPFIAETGGLNAMLVDSSALTEQVVRDVVASAFQSAGQRCSALRLLCLQEDIADKTLTMLKGAMNELQVGDAWHLNTDVGEVIDTAAQEKLKNYVSGHPAAFQISAPESGQFVAPTLIELDHVDQLDREMFGPILHVVRFKAADLLSTIESINAAGYGLTMGLQTRNQSRVQAVSELAEVGNLYVNRNQIGAVVGSQPFGGEGLSGTGPKAGGPLYLHSFVRAASNLPAEQIDLPGPTGELNRYRWMPKQNLWSVGKPGRLAEQARQIGCQVIEIADWRAVQDWSGCEGVLCESPEDLAAVRQCLARQNGPLIGLYTQHNVGQWVCERHLCVDTTAAGGNAELLAQAGNH